jgi:hypothetical protein
MAAAIFVVAGFVLAGVARLPATVVAFFFLGVRTAPKSVDEGGI